MGNNDNDGNNYNTYEVYEEAYEGGGFDTDYQGGGFDGYKPTTIDPTPYALIVTMAVCLTLILILPFLIAVRQHLLKQRRKEKSATSDTTTPPPIAFTKEHDHPTTTATDNDTVSASIDGGDDDDDDDVYGLTREASLLSAVSARSARVDAATTSGNGNNKVDDDELSHPSRVGGCGIMPSYEAMMDNEGNKSSIAGNRRGRGKFQHFQKVGRLMSRVLTNQKSTNLKRTRAYPVIEKSKPPNEQPLSTKVVTTKVTHQKSWDMNQHVETEYYSIEKYNIPSPPKTPAVVAPPTTATTTHQHPISATTKIQPPVQQQQEEEPEERVITTKVTSQILTDPKQDIETEYHRIDELHDNQRSAKNNNKNKIYQRKASSNSSDDAANFYDNLLLGYSDDMSSNGDDDDENLASQFAKDFFGDEDDDDEKVAVTKQQQQQQQQRQSTSLVAQPGDYVPMGNNDNPNNGVVVDDDDHHRSSTTHTKYDIHLCCTGRRPWFTYYCSRGFIRKVSKCMSYDDEMKQIMKYAVPYTLRGVIEDVLYLLEIGVISNIFAKGNSAILGGYFAIDMMLSLTTMLNDGAVNSLTILCSHAVGGRNYKLAGKYVQLAIILYYVVLFPIMAAIWFQIDDVILWLGFDEVVAEQAQDYGRFAFGVTAVQAINQSIHHMLDVTGLVWFSTMMCISHRVTSLIGVLAIGLIADEPKLWMIGLFFLILSIFVTSTTIIVCLYKNWLHGFWVGMASNAIMDRQAVRVFAKTAGPLSIGYIIEYGEWEVLFLFAASMGPAEVTVWGLLGYLWQFTEHFGEGIADAAEVRVAKLIGSNRPALACYSSHKSVFLGVFAAAVLSIIILLLQYQIAEWLTPDETLQDMLRSTLPLICVGVAALTFGSMSWTLLCAQGRTKLATAISFIGSVFVTLPLAAISTYVWNVNIEGLVASIIIGYSFGGVFNSFLMITTNWKKVCDKVVARNMKEKNERRKKKNKSSAAKDKVSEPEMLSQQPPEDNSESQVENYEDYDWEELPNEVKESAMLLGYTERIWDYELETELDDVEWDQLSPEQQKAAKVLGYNAAKWNG